MQPTTPITEVARVGPAYAKRLQKLGIKEVKDLLFHFPARYEDYSRRSPLASVKVGDVVTVEGHITNLKHRRAFAKHVGIVEATIEDASGTLPVLWFNQGYLAEALDTDKPVLLAGKITLGKRGPYLANPVHEVKRLGADPVHTARLVPIYPETRGVSSRWFRYVIEHLLPLADKLPDPLPEDLRAEHPLLPLASAIKSIHFPKTNTEADEARRRFLFEDVLCVQLAALKAKHEMQQESAPAIPTDVASTKAFTEQLPFTLTDSQKRAAWQILKDMERPSPMNRLLEGDVGSGKTVVAAVAALNAVRAGYRVAIMAPTEILAQQHYQNFSKLFYGHGLDIALLTRSKKDRAATAADVVVGTHAIIQDKVSFKNLGLIVIDEQHRFGVAQRATLARKGRSVNPPLKANSSKLTAPAMPHLLSMTATPIPRTLALTVYGDLDLTLLREMPAGRKKIETSIVAPAERAGAFSFIKKELKKGRQAFVIFPLVEESEKLAIKAATQEHERLSRGPLKQYRVGLLHGRMKTQEKDLVMHDFQNGKTHVLVSTAVVEVGVDIPNATIMMIEDADRFGLAQLYQFRGRVGRSTHQSYCFLLTDSNSAAVRKRLKALIQAQNGFELAEYDLALRGPGEVYGVRQSGLPDRLTASLSNVKLIEETRALATEVLERDPLLKKYAPLKARVETLQNIMHFE